MLFPWSSRVYLGAISPPDLPKLEALKISVFCREDIEQVLNRIEAPPTPDEVRNAVQSLIPTPAAPQGMTDAFSMQDG